MKTKIFGLLILFGGLSACAPSVESSESVHTANVPVDDGGGNEPPKPVAEFDYRKMLYGTDGVCGQGGFYFKLLSADDAVIGQRNGQDVMVDSRILLYLNGKFQVEITEKYIASYTATGYTYKKKKSRYIEGYYVLANGKLLLGDLMEITGRSVDNRIQASILYKKDVMYRGLAHREVMGHMVWSTSAIKSERETCPKSDENLGDFAKFQARPNHTVLQMKALSTTEPMYTSGFNFKSIQVFLESDGSYALVIQGSTLGSSSIANYYVDSGYWEQSGGHLVLYHGVLSLGYNSDDATLQFSRDLLLVGNGKAFSVPMTGKTISLKFGPSDLTKDDLTDTYR